MKHAIVLSLLALAAAACNKAEKHTSGPSPQASASVSVTPDPAPTATPSPTDFQDGVPPAMALADYKKGPQGDFPFDVKLKFAPEARDKLKALNEQVTIAAMFYGDPGKSAEAQAAKDEMDQINLEEDLVNVAPVDQTVRITGKNVDKAKLKLLEGEPQVLINVFSARKSGPDNILGCGIFQDTIKVAQKKPIEITCELLPTISPPGPK